MGRESEDTFKRDLLSRAAAAGAAPGGGGGQRPPVSGVGQDIRAYDNDI